MEATPFPNVTVLRARASLHFATWAVQYGCYVCRMISRQEGLPKTGSSL
jgi:hypothetical protein